MEVWRKLTWSALLIIVGIAAGFTLSLPDLVTKFLWVIAILPILAAVDVLVVRGARGFTYWFRACAFEVVTVFGSAALSRAVFDLIGLVPVAEAQIR